jgi:hypothetical protein
MNKCDQELRMWLSLRFEMSKVQKKECDLTFVERNSPLLKIGKFIYKCTRKECFSENIPRKKINYRFYGKNLCK